MEKKLFTTPISLAELRSAFQRLGIRPGMTVWVQSSWNEFYNYSGKPSSVIDLLLDMIGPEGTLVMSAIPLKVDDRKILEVHREPVSTGLIAETFRRYRGVKRSIHNSSSVIALGPRAEFLVKDHETTETPWDPESPYQKLMEVDALCVGLGVGRFLATLTPLHAVESILRRENPDFAAIFHGSTTYRWRTRDGNEGTHTYLNRNGPFDAAWLGRYYPRDQYIEFRLSNLWMWSIPARDAIMTGVSLGRRGINMYRMPWHRRLMT
ncbi:AAC(3) family N-acetyltransferase [Bradyrhizobium japonicum]|uniref:AAC(3) family N-acetyltransferase n=1 Tax=Bradyrhizobium japonicum TaxID=375 RepID=UPI0018AD3479|nr:AAC(3) family N-acetyltransferase [Bradyrhizobium japonicum]